MNRQGGGHPRLTGKMLRGGPLIAPQRQARTIGFLGPGAGFSDPGSLPVGYRNLASCLSLRHGAFLPHGSAGKAERREMRKDVRNVSDPFVGPRGGPCGPETVLR
mmetsp:Transcript_28311/g.52703  ORF Transcript_28311/g.52703 Transcript_28311/m.52703 type:complete len:105 (-) Transcript_28311:1260-1574(-)